MEKFECSGCGGRLKESGKFYICENCGTKYALGRNDEGNPFTYQPIEKKEVAFGQLAVKASEIKIENIAVKEIKLSDNIDAEVYTESTNIEINQNIRLISTFIDSEEWDAAQTQINQVLLADNSNAKVHWYGWMCDRHISNEIELIKSFASFTKNDAKKLDDILSNSTPEFAKHIIEVLFDNAYINDSMCFEIMSVVLPYAKNECVLGQKEFKNKTSNAIKVVTSKVFSRSFDLLLQCTLDEQDVDLYIMYLQNFGDNCNPALAQKYYSQILSVDPGNLDVHKKLVKSDIKANSDATKTTGDFESLLKYSGDTDKEVIQVLNFIETINPTTKNTSLFVWALIGYHSEAPEALKKYIFDYARLLLQSSLWDDARKYLQLILSFDAHNADAYWLLCSVSLRAKNEEDIIKKKENLIDCQEFKKALALYQSAGNAARANELMEFTKKQKEKKKAKKKWAIAIVAIIGFIALVCIYKNVKYNTNISISFDEESFSYGWSYEELPITIKSNALADISSFEGIMIFYDENNEKIATTRFNFSDITHGEERAYTITLDSTSAYRLSSYHFESVKITFTTTAVTFYSANTYKQKDLGDGKEKTIKKITKSSKDVEQEILSKVEEQYNKAMETYDAVDVNSSTFQTDIKNAVSMFEDIWDDILTSKTLLKDIYDCADRYENNKEYKKAYYLFSLLSDSDYEDSYSRAYDCYCYYYY